MESWLHPQFDLCVEFAHTVTLSCPTFLCMCVVNPSRKWANGNMLVGKLTHNNNSSSSRADYYWGTSGQIMHLDNLL